MDNPLLGGKIFKTVYDGWLVSWESNGNYRHWCRQHKIGKKYDEDVLIIMFNPGSLSKDGKNLSKDTTLRVLRSVFEHIPCNCLVVNLFDYATPKPTELLNKYWTLRDLNSKDLIFKKLNYRRIVTFMSAYGKYENFGNDEIKGHIIERIRFIKESLKLHKETEYIRNLTDGTPKHPFAWLPGNFILEARHRILKSILHVRK